MKPGSGPARRSRNRGKEAGDAPGLPAQRALQAQQVQQVQQPEPEDGATPSPAIPAAQDRQRHFHVTDWHGVSSLLLDATEGAIAIAEEVHGAVAETLPPLAPAGITGFAWRGVRTCIAVARRGSKALPQRERDAPTPEEALPLPTPQRRTALAALNGLLGDRLAASGNPLAIEMGLSLDGIALPLEIDALQALLARRPPQAKAEQAGERLLLLAHGLCQCDLQWHRHRHDHGAALQRDLGVTPLYLNYNSGLRVSENGRALAVMLETLLRAWPAPVRTLTLLGYSMGGLVLRSACRHAELAGHDWVGRIDRIVFLGTPHHGTPLARGNWLGAVLGHNRLTAPFTRLASLRSDGINDLRHGTVFDAEVQEAGSGQDTDYAHPVPLPQAARCHAIAATLGVRVGDLRDRLLGDGLVAVDSALGRHSDPARRLDIPDSHCFILHRSHHLDLLSSARVYRRLRTWLARPS